jgi:hypothetical protein
MEVNSEILIDHYDKRYWAETPYPDDLINTPNDKSQTTWF